MMTSPKPKLTELLDWIDSHLVYCFSLIRNKYFYHLHDWNLMAPDLSMPHRRAQQCCPTKLDKLRDLLVWNDGYMVHCVCETLCVVFSPLGG